MAVTPKGPISLPLSYLRTLVANCDAWRRWVGSGAADGATLADVADAEAHVHLADIDPPASGNAYTPEELEGMRPLAIVDEFQFDDQRVGGDGFKSVRDGLQTYVDVGKLFLRFEDDVHADDVNKPGDAKLRFMNNIGLVLSDLKDLGGGERDYLNVLQIVKFEPFRRSDVSQEPSVGDRWKVGYVVFWSM